MKLVYSISALLFTSLTLANPTGFSPSISHTNPVLRSLQKRCPPFDPSGVKNIGNGAGVQFVGGQCLSDADCQQSCCAKPCGICSGPKANFQNGKQGCGFGGAASVSAGTGNSNSTANANANTGSSTVSRVANANANTNTNTANEDDSNESSSSSNNGNASSCNGTSSSA